MKFYSWKNVANHCFNHEYTSVNMGKPGRIILPYRRANQQLTMHFEFGNKWSSSCVCLFLFRLMSSAQGKAKCAYIDWLMTVKLIFFVVMKEWPEFLNTFGIHYICASLLLLRVESRDFSQADRTACKAEQIHKMTTIFTQHGPGLSFWVKIVVIL